MSKLFNCVTLGRKIPNAVSPLTLVARMRSHLAVHTADFNVEYAMDVRHGQEWVKSPLRMKSMQNEVKEISCQDLFPKSSNVVVFTVEETNTESDS